MMHLYGTSKGPIEGAMDVLTWICHEGGIGFVTPIFIIILFKELETTLSCFWGTWGTDLTYAALGALAWGTGALRMGHLGHSLGALVVLGHYVWGTTF